MIKAERSGKSPQKEHEMTAQEFFRYHKEIDQYKDSPYRRYREYYGDYLNRYMNDKINRVDGKDYKQRMQSRPMSMTEYFIG